VQSPFLAPKEPSIRLTEQGDWALPGGFVDEFEPLQKAAERELQEETSINPNDVDLFQATPISHCLSTMITQIGGYGDPGRDPRGWTVSILYAAVLDSDINVQAAVATSLIQTSILVHDRTMPRTPGGLTSEASLRSHSITRSWSETPWSELKMPRYKVMCLGVIT